MSHSVKYEHKSIDVVKITIAIVLESFSMTSFVTHKYIRVVSLATPIFVHNFPPCYYLIHAAASPPFAPSVSVRQFNIHIAFHRSDQ